MADQAMKKLEDQLQCSVCLDKYKDPKLLECFHIFCKECLDKLLMEEERQFQKNSAASLSCPICRQTMSVPNGGVGGFKPAFHINQLLEIREGLLLKGERTSHKGEEGRILVTDCAREEATPQLLEASSISTSEEPIEDDNLSKMCPTHKSRKVEFFCETCDQLICTRCIVAGSDHHSHRFEETDKVVDRYRKDIEGLVPHLTSKFAPLQRAVEKLEASNIEMTAHESSLVSMINHSINELHEALEVRRAQLIEQISEVKHEGIHMNALQREELGRFESKLRGCSECMHECVKIGNKTSVLSLRNSFLSRSKDLEEEFASLMTRTLNAKTAHLNFTSTSDLLSSCKTFGKLSTELHSVVGERFSSTFEALVSEEDNRSLAVLQRFQSELVSQVTKEKVLCEVEALGPSQYRISCTPTLKGRHLIYVKFDGRNVSGSPFSLLVRPQPGSDMGPPLNIIDDIKGPNGVCFTNSGQLLVTENDSHCVSLKSLDGTRVFSFGSKGSADGKLLYPRGITISGKGEVVIADTSNYRLSIFQQDGHFTMIKNLVGKKSSTKLMPMDVVWNTKNNQFYVACSNQIVILDSCFSLVGTFGRTGTTSGAFKDPYGIACDGKGRVYVADTMNNRIQIFSPSAQFLREIADLGNGSRLEYPISLAISGNHLYVSEYMRHRVVKLTTRGALVTTVGKRGKAVDEFSSPRGIAVDPTGLLCVCDYDNNRLCLI